MSAVPVPISSKQIYRIQRGSPHPLGAIPDAHGVNFSVFAHCATGVELLIFDEHDDAEPAMTVQLDPTQNKTFQFWHTYVRGLKPGAHYAYRVEGPQDLHARGDRFNRNKVLIDPYARGNTNALWRVVDACTPNDNVATSMRSVVIDCSDYDWEGDQPLQRPLEDTIIYELHVRGFTRSSSSGCKNPGTFSGVIEKIPYLQSLGVTAVELMPIFDFDEKEVLRLAPDGAPLRNYWGYDTFSFFSPQSSYCISPEAGSHIREFRDMVKALHKAGIEVILDVVYNHTAEGNHQGPTINFRGLANSVYYHLESNDMQYYTNFSGCGNTVKGNHPIVQKFIIESLEFWVREMHVDGFRFDEAVILTRGEDGSPMLFPPVVWQIELSETLADTKIIAEAWDAAGLYEVGYFPGFRWGEWNGKYRDTIRRFVRGDRGIVGEVASRMAGSADIFESNGELPMNSINFIACHDGFTLNDLASYNWKHNEANGESNRDGMDENLSWNCGSEGDTADPEIHDLRRRQVKNFSTILMLSQGVPMLLAGDEVCRTQKGNNNAYCQDNPLAWMDWELADKNADMLRFFQNIIAFRRRHRDLRRSRFFTGQANERGIPDVSWHGCRLNSPGWQDPTSAVLAFTLAGFEGDDDLHAMLNMDMQDLEFDIPNVQARNWHLAVDTGARSPHDIFEVGEEPAVHEGTYLVRAHSVVVLVSKAHVSEHVHRAHQVKRQR